MSQTKNLQRDHRRAMQEAFVVFVRQLSGLLAPWIHSARLVTVDQEMPQAETASGQPVLFRECYRRRGSVGLQQQLLFFYCY